MSDSPSGATLRDLKARAQLLQPTVRIGRAGLDPAFYQNLNQALQLRQLVKVKFETHKEQKKEWVPLIASTTGSHVVLFVGHTATFFRSA
jgi:RNA-binding protein